tara:strand:+ start:9848 stop:10864 length:1017 start_codon:yes stop_codon:yes gene_type:complete
VKPIYIHSAVCITAQDNFEDGIMVPLNTSEGKVQAKHPEYRDFIPPAAARRMAPAVKMGVAAASKALQKANVEQPDAIITGSGMGCMLDTEKFLNALIENKEEFLTPTAFIQSTHNTVGGQIALGLHCKAYNNTYVHGSLSFESALFDAQLALQEGSATTVLVGCVDELGTEFVEYVRLKEQQETIPKQVPYGEGTAFFVLSQEVKEEGVILRGLQTFRTVSEDDITEKMLQFLRENQLETESIDAVFLGTTGDSYDGYYNVVSKSFLPKIVRIPFKEYSGDFYTCMGFAVWWAQYLLQEQCAPGYNCEPDVTPKYQNILIYTQEKGQNHSFILLSKT